MLLGIQWPLVLFGIICGAGGTLACSIGVSELTGKAKEARFVSAIVALVLMVIGGVAVVFHLALPLNAFYAITNLGSLSGISVELIMLIITFVVVLAYAIVLKREAAASALKVLAVLAIVAGLVLAFVCGHGYVLQSREYWDTELLPLAYMGTVLPVGAFLYVALASKLGSSFEDLQGLRAYVIACVAISIVTTAAYMVFLGGGALAREPFVSYGMLIVCGIVGELAVLFAYLKAKDEKQLFIICIVGLVLAVVAALGVRLEMWLTSDPYFNAFYWEMENGTPIGTDNY